MTIKYVLSVEIKHNADLLYGDLYFPVIIEDKNTYYVGSNLLKNIDNEEYAYCANIEGAILFNQKEDIDKLNILNNLNYTIFQLKDLYSPAHVIVYLPNTETIKIAKRWHLIGETSDTHNSIVTHNYSLAEQKLNEFKFRKIKQLQEQIYNISQIELSE